MSDEISLTVKTSTGGTEQKRVPISASKLVLIARYLRTVPDNIAQLTRVVELRLHDNSFAEIPSVVFAMTQLNILDMGMNCLAAMPREIGRLRALKELDLEHNMLTALPHEIGQLCALELLDLGSNSLTSLPAELGQLTTLRVANLQLNRLTWVPSALGRLPAATEIYLNNNRFPISVGYARSELGRIFAATTWPTIYSILEPAFNLLVGLQDLALPALVSLEILDAAFPNSVPMHKKWDLVVAVKHFHQRRGIEH